MSAAGSGFNFLLQVAAAAKVKQNSSSGDQAQLPVKTQKILDEKNELILKMREEIQANNFLSLLDHLFCRR